DRLPDGQERRPSRGPEVDVGALQALVLRELEAGEQSRLDLNTIAEDELGASPDQVYRYGLKPLHGAKQIRVQKDRLAGGWYWSLCRSPEPLPVEAGIRF